MIFWGIWAYASVIFKSSGRRVQAVFVCLFLFEGGGGIVLIFTFWEGLTRRWACVWGASPPPPLRILRVLRPLKLPREQF